jgi:hypothetical protein
VRLLGRRANGVGQHGEPGLQHGSVSRGAWYRDPFGTADERWWDGGKWTDVVRGSPKEDAPEAQPRKMRMAGSGRASGGDEQIDETPAHQDGPASFPAMIEAVAGEELRVLPRDRKPPTEFDVLAAGGRAGSISLGGRTELAVLACAEGAWCLKKRHRLGWELVIESSDGRHVGWYSGRRWLAGGTIYLIDGTQVDLRRSLHRRWRLQATDTGQRVADIRTSGMSTEPTMALTMRVHPAGITDVHLVVLTSCAVLMLERTLHPVIALGGTGS